MIWLIINVSIAVVAVCMICYANHIDCARNRKAAAIWSFGVILIVCDLVSFGLWAFFGRG